MDNISDPIIFQNNVNRSNRVFVIIPIIILVVVLLVLGYFFIQNNKTLSSQKLQVVPLGSGKITLQSPKQEFKVGDQVPVVIGLSTGGRTIVGVDLVLSYNPQVLDATSSSNITVFTSSGELFSEFPIISVDRQKGIAKVSAIASLGKIGFNGLGLLGTINFIAKSVGDADIKIDYSPNQTIDSNMLEYATGIDILGEVKSINVKIN